MHLSVAQTITGEKTLIHNSAGCNTLAAGLDLASGLGGANDTNFALELTAAGIVAAITPLNNATYQFIYPEDNQIFGTSFSTNVGSTTLQGEVSYRPDFPLATPASSQINQISDASGATQMLNWVAYTGLNALGTNTTRGGNNDSTDVSGDTLQALLWATQTATDAAFSDDNAYENLVRDFKRSSLPAISQATVTAGDYFSTPFIEYDVWSVDIGTTTSFTASDPVTQGLGADSAAFLTEIAMVTIDGLDNSNGYVARGGFAASGDAPAKCMGAVGTSMAPAAGTSTVVGLGASIHDGLFGNGGYCEDQPGADETSFSYRLVGTATYNNFNNSRWALSPNFAFAHDPSGYGPSSLGGFVEDKMSLSLGVNAKYKRILTGSPVTKSPLDLYKQCEFLDPWLLDHNSYYSFRTRYAIMKTANFGGRSVQIVVGYRNLGELSDKLKPFSHRVLKDDWTLEESSLWPNGTIYAMQRTAN